MSRSALSSKVSAREPAPLPDPVRGLGQHPPRLPPLGGVHGGCPSPAFCPQCSFAAFGVQCLQGRSKRLSQVAAPHAQHSARTRTLAPEAGGGKRARSCRTCWGRAAVSAILQGTFAGRRGACWWLPCWTVSLRLGLGSHLCWQRAAGPRPGGEPGSPTWPRCISASSTAPPALCPGLPSPFPPAYVDLLCPPLP